jgi:Fe2+ or Zn2+ uptake regulation protein
MIEQTSRFSQFDEHDYEVICDECEDSLEFTDTTWNNMLADVKAAGWKIKKVGEEWKHWCGDCKTKS